MRETGLLNRYRSQHLQRKPTCGENDARDISMVQFHEIEPVLLSYLLAVVLSMTLLAIEIHVYTIISLYDKLKKMQQKSPTK